MVRFNDDPLPERENKSIFLSWLLFLGIGFVYGYNIGGDKKEKIAIDWVVESTKKCESSFISDGFSSVSDCLRRKVEEAEEEAHQGDDVARDDPRF